MKIILASASPRRKEILTLIGLPFLVYPAKGEERTEKTEPAEVVKELSHQKAVEISDAILSGSGKNIGSEELWEEAYGDSEDCLIIGADTVVSVDQEILGKPVDEEDAAKMLQKLQGRTHEVHTGVTLILIKNRFKKIRTFSDVTEVTFYPMTEEEIRSYIRTEEPMDKAGAYAIQGKCAVYIKGIRGDFYNVMGLPAARMMQELKAWGITGLR